MGDNRSVKEIPLITQEQMLLKAFPNSYTERGRFKLVWAAKLKPTPLSREYLVAVKFGKGKVEVFVVEPKKLDLYPGKKLLPHVYSTSKQKLCLYFPDGSEWNKGKLLVSTIIPWACEWLYFYEIWLFTGEWYGGGTEHNFEESIK